jgi:threonine aldolase
MAESLVLLSRDVANDQDAMRKEIGALMARVSDLEKK